MAKNWAIAIGINHYTNLSSLKYAQRDAELMQEYFLNEAGFEKVYLFSDNSPRITDSSTPFSSQPTYGTLKRFLRVRFDKPFLQAGDNLWFFFSGHGLRHADRDYLMPSDADPDPEGVEHTAIPIHYVTERLRRCGAGNVVLFLDACRNEAGSKGLGVGAEKQQGVITIASCNPGEKSYEIDQIQQGSFTYALLEALRIQGEGNCATVERLYQHLSYRVPEINQNYNKPVQTPYPVVEPATKYHLILLPKQATLQDIAKLREDAQDAELNGDLELAEQLWTRVLAVSSVDTKALLALKRIWNQPQSQVKPPKPGEVQSVEAISSLNREIANQHTVFLPKETKQMSLFKQKNQLKTLQQDYKSITIRRQELAQKIHELESDRNITASTALRIELDRQILRDKQKLNEYEDQLEFLEQKIELLESELQEL